MRHIAGHAPAGFGKSAYCALRFVPLEPDAKLQAGGRLRNTAAVAGLGRERQARLRGQLQIKPHAKVELRVGAGAGGMLNGVEPAIACSAVVPDPSSSLLMARCADHVAGNVPSVRSRVLLARFSRAGWCRCWRCG